MGCRHQYSVTGGTIFASRTLPIRNHRPVQCARFAERLVTRHIGAMQFGAVTLPVAAATIVNVILAWLAWQATLAGGRGIPSRQFEVGLGAYLAALAASVYLLKDAQISTPLSLFGAAFVSEAFGGLVLYGIGRAYQMRGEPWRKRALPTAAALFFTVVVFAGVFAS